MTTNILFTFLWKINVNILKFKNDFSALIAEQIKLFGSFPENEYHFLFIIPSFPVYHGVEHSASTVIMLGKDTDFEKEYFYKNLIGISSHELFHAWNICKIRPKKLLPYNLSKPQYFVEAFVVEGVTTYYGDLMLMRAGVWSFENYATEFAKNIKNHFHNRAKNKATFLDTEIGLWVDGYKNTQPSRKISIYDKGAIVAFIFDIKIRMHSQNKASLNNVMKEMWETFGKNNIGYTCSDYILLAEKWSNHSFIKYETDIVFGCVSLENYLSACLDYLGLELQFYPSENTLQNHFGIKFNANFCIIDLAISSPGEKFLDIDDIIKKINNQDITPDLITSFLTNQTIEIEVERHGERIKIMLVRDGSNYFQEIVINKQQKPNYKQLENFILWSKT